MENEPSTTTSSTGTTTIATTSSPSRTQPPQISVYSGSDRHAVQVIQQALHRPPSSAAQYLQQMYAAQQQHLMLQTAALQQQHLSSTQFQSLASVPQANLSGGRQCASPNGNVTQQSSMSETSINLSASPTPAQLISRSQASNTSSSSLTQQTMLLGSTSPTLTASQAQMYLRAQMLIFTPATTVAAVQSDIPVVSSSSSFPCQSAATQIESGGRFIAFRLASSIFARIIVGVLYVQAGDINKTNHFAVLIFSSLRIVEIYFTHACLAVQPVHFLRHFLRFGSRIRSRTV
uniref:Polyhomeotic homolog 3 n=1 Tax=Anolis carolinensis TaxID=28377 RepID=A0A803SRI3_ANOCA